MNAALVALGSTGVLDITLLLQRGTVEGLRILGVCIRICKKGFLIHLK